MRGGLGIYCAFSVVQEERMDTAQVSLSKLKSFQPLILDLQLLEASKPCMCEKEEREKEDYVTVLILC